ncbi:CAAX prenyl protease 2-like isoform X2 [Artemia franciscana]|uniref:CAAX prenyl protease 2 n=1 Tax=Artemia franciscana TaxID=6661 RepID=A0AA88H9F0_ARTSF|nr:hypothetical protein QYM36_018480 [Artemia franciscana]
MTMNKDNMFIQCVSGIGACFILAVTYVSSLYVWTVRYREPRDHPATIRRRFISAFCMLFVSPLFVWISINQDVLNKVGLLQIMGLRLSGSFSALIFPAILTVILFAGPLAVLVYDGMFFLIFNKRYLTLCLRSLHWQRNYAVAPLSEEFTFRACMMPILSQFMSTKIAILVCPWFFGVGIQCGYTSLFGLYSAFLFARTGHFLAPFIAHVICNFMGFPDFVGVLSRKDGMKGVFICVYIAGFVFWCMLLFPLTNPALYDWQWD